MFKNIYLIFCTAVIVLVIALHSRQRGAISSTVPVAGKVGEPTETRTAWPAVVSPVPSLPPRENSEQLLHEIRSLLGSGEGGRDFVKTNLLVRLVELNAAAAAQLVQAMEAGADRNEMLWFVAQSWTDKDLPGALAWAAQLPDAGEQKAILSNVALRLAQSNPAQAVDVATQYHLDAGACDLLPSLAVQWANADLSAAMAWAGRLPAGEQRDEIFSRIAFVEAQSAPADAGRMVLAEIPPGPVQEEAVLTVIHQWARQDMPGTLAWVRAFPEIPLKDRAFAELHVIALNQRPP